MDCDGNHEGFYHPTRFECERFIRQEERIKRFKNFLEMFKKSEKEIEEEQKREEEIIKARKEYKMRKELEKFDPCI